MGEATLDLFATGAGVVALTLLVTQIVKFFWPDPSVAFLRGFAVIFATAATVGGVAAGLAPLDTPDGANTALVVVAWGLVVLNGALNGIAAFASFDTVKSGIGFTVNSS